VRLSSWVGRGVLAVTVAWGAAAIAAEGSETRSVLQGLAIAQTAMARNFLFGSPASRDSAKAISLLRSASASNYGPAEFVLGAVLANDSTDTAKVREGSDYLTRAAHDGCAGAAGLLGNMLFAARERHPEIEPVALKFLRTGAEGGDALSQGLLAVVYSRGSPSLPKDLVAAYAWAHLAGSSHAKQPQRMADISAALEKRITTELSEQDRRAAERLAAEYTTRYARADYPFCSQSGDANKPPK
jgi:TPR repeat protein